MLMLLCCKSAFFNGIAWVTVNVRFYARVAWQSYFHYCCVILSAV
jgi:hypothetical protein